MAAEPLQPIPIDLVTGFLGAGKTTLINAVLRDQAFAGAMVIVNEFGQVGLDHLLFSSAQDNVVLLDSGCLCCAASGTLRDTLIDLFSRRAGGTVAGFDRLIVETSGLADPGPLVASLLGDSALRPRCALAQVLTLVDAVTGLESLDRYVEAQRQVAFADRLLISKVDLAGVAQIDALSAELAHLNPGAAIGQWQPGGAPGAHFASVRGHVTGGLHGGIASPAIVSPAFAGRLPSQYSDGPGRHGSSYRRIRTHVLQVPRAISWTEYAAWTEALRSRFKGRLLRCKGLLQIETDDRPWVIQGVQGYFAPPQPLASWPETGPFAFLVVIGEAITRVDLLDALGSRDLQLAAETPSAS